MMDSKMLAGAVEQPLMPGRILVATSDEGGQPHIGTARNLAILKDGTVSVTGWLDPATVATTHKGLRVALLIRDSDSQVLFQMHGEVERVQLPAASADWDPSGERVSDVREVEPEMVVRVGRIAEFAG